ncbi:MAG: hypothetical protein COV44_04350 [Deltaproteobacteria bacterium CG11_big_fil_rev_8_21_14_0_20_45_16]|nr:MAG: hypothetical protein COV44_04350 [Deltaproteobacteria bacterium CG11_big_fil_rev_8_21_14_0_20_45_16]
MVIALILNFVFLSSISSECQSYESAVTLYRSNEDLTRSREILECRIVEYPDDHESREFLYEHLSRYFLRTSYDDVRASRSSSYELMLVGGIRYFRKNELHYEFLREVRLYEAGTRLVDQGHLMRHILVAGGNFYMEASARFIQDADFLASQRYYLEPHFASGRWDVYAGGGFSRFKDVDVWSVRPGFIFAFSDRLSVGVRLDLALKPERAVSFTQQVKIVWLDQFESRADLSGGKSDEGNNQIVTFFSGSLGLDYFFHPALRITGRGSYLQNELRSEWRLGSEIGFRM